MLDHFTDPRNVGVLDPNDPEVVIGDGGSMECGDFTRLFLRIGSNQQITDAKFQTYGCGSAIASSSLLTEKIIGKTIEQALQVTNEEIARELLLPPHKAHCSVLAEDTLKATVENYRQKKKH
ncbi:MAG: Fe-S cluster assembly scaffold IscU [Planctomycetes bacterium]|nr:Fe-S cluster assembly scaffold IscU [Planctomycetota bacterium]